MTFLAEASELLASSLDYNHTLRQVAQLSVPGLADWCAIDMVGPRRRDRAARRRARGSGQGALGLRAAGPLPARPRRADRSAARAAHRRAGVLPRAPARAAGRGDRRRRGAAADHRRARAEIDHLRAAGCAGPDAGRADADRGRDAPAVHGGRPRTGGRARAPRRGRRRQRTPLPRGRARRQRGARARLRRRRRRPARHATASVRHWNPAAASITGVDEERGARLPGRRGRARLGRAHLARAARAARRRRAGRSRSRSCSAAASAGCRSRASSSATAPSTRCRT